MHSLLGVYMSGKFGLNQVSKEASTGRGGRLVRLNKWDRGGRKENVVRIIVKVFYTCSLSSKSKLWL